METELRLLVHGSRTHVPPYIRYLFRMTLPCIRVILRADTFLRLRSLDRLLRDGAQPVHGGRRTGGSERRNHSDRADHGHRQEPRARAEPEHDPQAPRPACEREDCTQCHSQQTMKKKSTVAMLCT